MCPPAEPSDVPAIAVDGLRFDHADGTRALDGMDLYVARGERVAILGPHGAGKTTLALHLSGRLVAQHGVVRIGGLDVAEHRDEVTRRVGLVMQNPDDQLVAGSVHDNVTAATSADDLDGPELATRVHEALATVGLVDMATRPAAQLNPGQRRRVAIAMVLAMRPEVLVMDEPTAAMDPVSVHSLSAVVAGLGMTLIVITHDLPFALQTCTRTVVLDRGKVVARRGTRGLLADNSLMAAHRLSLPMGWASRRRDRHR